MISTLFLIIALSLQSSAYSSENYINKEFIDCGNEKVSIPSYFPYTEKESNLFITVDSKCSTNAIKLYVGRIPDCIGQNICAVASFLAIEIDSDLKSKFDQSFDTLTEDITLGNGIVGYYIPSKCHTYCSEAKFIWFTQKKVYVLGTYLSKNKQRDMIEFEKAIKTFTEKNND